MTLQISTDLEENRALNHDAPIILAYHGVTAGGFSGIENFSGKHMEVESFRQQMAYLRDNHQVVHLSDLFERIMAGKPGGDLVALTFDDGYENNYSVAWPILREMDLPATFFISTGFVGTERLFWVDEVEHLINATTVKHLTLMLDSGPCQFSLNSPITRIQTVIAIKRVLKNVSPEERHRVLDELRQQTGIVNGARPATYRVMSEAQLAEMAADPLVEIGCHTVNHEILSNLDPSQQRHEIAQSRQFLKDLPSFSNTFAYPNGREHDYDDHSVDLLDDLGFTCGVTAEAGFVMPGEGIYTLPRVIVRDNQNKYMRSTIGAKSFPFPLEEDTV